MPTYDYVCEACGHEFEHFQPMSGRHLRTCPKCGKKKLIRKVGAGAGLIFKGSGFYATDYKKAEPPASDAKPADKPAEKTTAPKDAPATKTDAKQTSKPTSKPDKKDST